MNKETTLTRSALAKDAPLINLPSLTQSHWSEQDNKNAKVVIDLIQTMMNEHDFVTIRHLYASTHYKQHNRTMKDGIEGVIESLSSLVKRFPEFSYEVKHLYVDGDKVIVHSHATLKVTHRGDDSKGLNIIDTWLVKDGKAVEHWDAVEGINTSMRLYGLLTGGSKRNDNGVF